MTRLALAATVALLAAGPARAGISVDFEAEVTRIREGKAPPVHLSGQRHRVAVFTFEDPDGTGLGDVVSGLVAHRILVDTPLRSLGVVRYEGRLAPSSAEPDARPGAAPVEVATAPSYFDKVDLVAAAQGVELSVWGSLRRSRDRILVETYLQLSPGLQDRLAARVPVPGRIPGASRPRCGELVAHARPDRILLQQGELRPEDVAAVTSADARLRELRMDASPAAPIVGRIERDAPFGVSRSRGVEGWVLVTSRAASGWVPRDPRCPACGFALESGDFAGALLASTASGRAAAAGPSLSTEASAVRDQLAVLQAIGAGPAAVRSTALPILDRWDPPGAAGGDAAGARRAVPPGGAAFANLRALTRVVLAVEAEVDRLAAGRRGADRAALRKRVTVPTAELRAIAFDLADALQVDPRNADVLGNLAVLFRCAGDAQRARVAADLAPR